MGLPRLFQQWLRLCRRRSKPAARRAASSAVLRLEILEDRRLLSTWIPKGPAPILNGQTPGADPVSGRIAALAASPTDANTIYVAAAGGGVWKTTTGGASWAPLTDSQSTLFMGAIAVSASDPNTIYAGTGEATNSGLSFYGRGVLKSSDGGATWTLEGNSVFDRRTISQLAIDPTDPNTVYVAVAGSGVNGLAGNTGIWRSTDGGATWTNTTTAISTSQSYTDVVMDPTNPLTLFAVVGSTSGSAANGLYKTSDGGATWSRLGGGMPSGLVFGLTRVAVAPADPQVVYASVAGTGAAGSSSFGHLFKMMKSTDGGSTWSQLTATPDYLAGSAWYSSTLAVDPANADAVYAAAIGETVIRTLNGGSTWSSISTGANGHGPHADHHGIGFDAAGRLLDGNDGGIWRLNSGAPVQWADLNGNLQITQFSGVDLHPTNPNGAVAGSQDNGTEVTSGSLSWTETEAGDGGLAKFSPTNPSRVYHQIPAFGVNFFRRSDNGGSTWITKTSGISADVNNQNFFAPFVVDPGNGDHVLYGTDRIWETTNGGDSWATISPVLVSTSTFVDSIALTGDPNTIYVSAGGHVLVTTNHGASWVDRSIPGATDHISELKADPTDSQIAYAVRDRFGGGHVFRTTNGGVNWSNVSGNLPNLPTYAIASAPGVLYVGDDNGVFVSTDQGASWQPEGTGLPNVQVRELVLNATTSTLAAATHGRGLWTEPLRTVLTITGTSSDDTITVRNVAGDPTSVEVIVNGSSVFTGAWSGLSGIVIAATSGNDTINVENVAAGTPITVNLGDGTDVVNLAPAAQNLDSLMEAVTVNGGSGSDTLVLDDQGFGGARTFTVTAATVDWGGPAVTYSGLAALTIAGGSGNNTLVGPNAASTWNITANNAGTLVAGTGTVTFSSIGNLTGGAAADTFVVSDGAGISGSVDGGGGSNTLDYSAYSTTVIVDLQTNAGTGVGGSVLNIQNVTGGSGGGPGIYNILVGNGGNVLTGGDGRRNLLIAGASASTLLGGNDDDILIGGTTAYDTEAGLVSLQAIMNYWSGTTDGYAMRVSVLTNGIGVPLLDASTVTNNGGGNTMTGNHGGAGEMNLFYGLDPTMETADYNPGIGEQFINC